MRHHAGVNQPDAPALSIAPATPEDAAACAEIYRWHVLNGVATFETEPPDAAEMATRLSRIQALDMPWLVMRDRARQVVGYAYAGPYHPRAAYRFTCENSVYLCHDQRGKGLGSALLAALLEACNARGLRQMVALISATEAASIALHARFGFAEAGRLASVGFKHGRWIDVVLMQRALGAGDSTIPGDTNA